jgi:hypothetical protein
MELKRFGGAPHHNKFAPLVMDPFEHDPEKERTTQYSTRFKVAVSTCDPSVCVNNRSDQCQETIV